MSGKVHYYVDTMDNVEEGAPLYSINRFCFATDTQEIHRRLRHFVPLMVKQAGPNGEQI